MARGKMLTTQLLSQGYQKTKLVAILKKFYGRHHDLVNLYNVAVSRIVSDVFASDVPSVDFPNPGFYRYFLRSGLWAWWAKLAYHVMLTIRGRLITPFILGSISVGLNILIRLRIYEFRLRFRYHDRNYIIIMNIFRETMVLKHIGDIQLVIMHYLFEMYT